MAETTTKSIRRGLPRVRGGEPWPPAAAVEVAARAAVGGAATDAGAGAPAGSDVAAASVAPAAAAGAPATVDAAVAPAEATTNVAGGSAPGAQVPTRIRRGLPRVAGGAPWPEVGLSEVAAAETRGSGLLPGESPVSARLGAPTGTPAVVAPPAAQPATATSATQVPKTIRRGLPRVAGGPAWPEVDDAALAAAAAAAPAPAPASAGTGTGTGTGTNAAATIDAAIAPTEAASTVAEPTTTAAGTPADFETPAVPAPQPAAAASVAAAPAATKPAPAPAAKAAAAQASVPPSSTAKAEPRLYRGLTLSQWVWRSIGGVIAIAAFVGLVVLAARGLLTFAWAQDFVRRFPGAYALPDSAPVGFPLWLEWQHFLNAFFMLLIIRTGIQIRGERKPPASWSPRWNPQRRVSITVWLHQSLDLLWVANGVIFIVALFSTGQWMRIVPTSWSVFPNAFTAAIKYASLSWPTEDGWANYNSLQQLSYFAVVFLIAPLAMITGVRMSGLWNKKWERASRLYPLPLARAIHFPTMIVFCAFIVVHVVLVLATGALRNLNHMYGHSDVVSWTGFWLFVAALVVMAGGWVAARPLVTAPIASLFGKVGR
ncbi:cytochrome b/b6 domain-containing protein [Gryllotalpicola koreensis]|uniref:Cytochrome b561 bacterial/Ni-hydrogenase domain-containing protein n=1 Tax=Gryllotalpicola koreensis TaxID=993086 RepID=A0ABP7ZRE2_9MICO